MTNYPPGGNPPPGQPQDPGYGGTGPGYGGQQDPGHGGPGYDRGYGAPQDPPGYDPPGGPGQQAPWDYREQPAQQPYYQGAPGPGYALEPSLAYGPAHGQAYPVQLSVEYPEQSSRVLAGLSIPFFLLRLIMLIPAVFVLYFVGIAAGVVVWIAFWAVLFTGRYPPAFHNFVTGYVRWSTRCTCFLYGLTDKYPPFSLEP
jgi:Domain of unknown function (DUF4389)